MYTIKPGILVSLKTRVVGGISYVKSDIAEETDGKTEIKQWHTTKTVVDADEVERAQLARSRAATAVRSCCIGTPFGLLCPASRVEELDAAVIRARSLTDSHNDASVHTTVELFVLRGQVASDDVEAMRAIGAEMAALSEDMKAGIDNVNPKRIREAAKRAKELGAMLDEANQEKVKAAVLSARKAARDIVRRIEKGGENAQKVIQDLDTANVVGLKFAFLDVDSTSDAESPAADADRFGAIEAEEK